MSYDTRTGNRQGPSREKSVYGDDRSALRSRHPNGISREDQLRAELVQLETVMRAPSQKSPSPDEKLPRRV